MKGQPEVITRYQYCTPLAADVGAGDEKFNEGNIDKHYPVSLAGVPSTNSGLPVVEITKGAATADTIYGKFTGISADSSVVTIAVEGIDMVFRRATTAAAVVASDIGKGIVGGGASADAEVVAATVGPTTRGVIVGGNTAVGAAESDDNPDNISAFFRVNFRSS